jgi:hypothetical protein
MAITLKHQMQQLQVPTIQHQSCALSFIALGGMWLIAQLTAVEACCTHLAALEWVEWRQGSLRCC